MGRERRGGSGGGFAMFVIRTSVRMLACPHSTMFMCHFLDFTR